MSSRPQPDATREEQNVALVREALDAFNRGDRDALHELISDDFEYDWTRSEGPMQGIYRGHEGLDRVLDEQWTIFEEFEIEVHERIPLGNDVIVSNTVRARGRNGIEVSANSVHVYTLDGGRATRVTLYQDLHAALAAATDAASGRDAPEDDRGHAA